MSLLWERLAGTQPVPPLWVVVVSGLAALGVVLDVRGWHLARNAITIAHEGGHALVSVLSGRRLEGIRLHSDTSGETVSRGRGSGPGMVLTAFAGYVTPPLLGAGAAVLLDFHHVTLLLWAFLLLLLAAFVMMRNAFGLLVAVVAGGAVFGVTAYGTALIQSLFSYGVAWFLLFGGLRPVIELARSRRRDRRRRRGQVSDADQLARLTGVSSGVWVCLFALVAVIAIVVGARLLVPGTVHVPHAFG
jgi:Peptidase M50B-like